MRRGAFIALTLTLALLPFAWIWLAPSFNPGPNLHVVRWYSYSSSSGGHGGWLRRSFSTGWGGESTGGAAGFRGGGPGRAGK